jgi:2-alkenal reductase
VAALGPVEPVTPPHWLEPETPPEPEPGPEPSGPSPRGLFATALAAALVAALLASGGTYLALDAAGSPPTAPPLATPAPATPAGPTPATAPAAVDESAAIEHAAATVSPAVVTITTRQITSNDVLGGSVTTGVGSGIIYDGSGWILTNRHVVCGNQKVTVQLKDGRQLDGTVYGVDTLTDLAIVRVSATDLPAAPVGESRDLEAGQLAVAIGSPLGQFTDSVTAGVVSAMGRDITVNDDCSANGGTTVIRNLIQTDAAINPGNSGGALVDAQGDVIGVNTAVAGRAQGIGFAIPIDAAKPIMRQAVAGEPLSRPWLGVVFEQVDQQVAQANKLPVDYGDWIVAGSDGVAVVPGSPADKAGLRQDDILTAVDGRRLDATHTLDDVLLDYKPGDAITLSVLRAGRTLSVKLILGTRPAGLQ